MAGVSKRLFYGWTELHVAADAGDLARVRQAVQKTPNDLDRITKDGRTALHLAAASGFEAVVGELLDRQAKTTKVDESGRTPLHLAAVAGRGRCVATLMGPRNRDSPAEKARLLAMRDREGRDALMAAVVEGQEEAVGELLRAGADATRCVDQSQCGVVVVAVQRGHTHLLQPLTRACGGADTQRDPTTGGTPLHLAAVQGHLHMIDCLLAAGASTTTRDNGGRTASEAALAAGQHAALRALRDAPARAAGGGGAAAAAAPYDHCLLQRVSPAPAGPSGGSVSGGGGGAPWGELPLSPSGSAAGSAAGGAGSEVRGSSSAGRLQIPTQAPQPVYYPTPPPGAGVYF